MIGFDRHWEANGEEYHRDRTHISSSMIRHFHRYGPMSYYYQYLTDGRSPKPKSDAMQLGTVFHLAMQGPSYLSNVVTVPTEIHGAPVNRRLKAHREYLEAWSKEQTGDGRVIAPATAMKSIQDMAASLNSNAAVRDLLKNDGKSEWAIRWQDSETGLNLKALADLWIPESGAIIDFKTTRHFRPRDFYRDAEKKGYFEQAGHYCDGFDASAFVIITIRNSPPYECMAYSLSNSLIQAGRRTNRHSVLSLSSCYKSGCWQHDGHGELIELRPGMF